MNYLNKKLQVALWILILIFFNVFVIFSLIKTTYSDIVSWGALFLTSLILLPTELYKFLKTEKEKRKNGRILLYTLLFAVAFYGVLTAIIK